MDDAIRLVPRSALLQHGLAHAADEQGLKQTGFGLMEQQISMVEPVGGQRHVKDQLQHGLRLVDLAKGIGAVSRLAVCDPYAAGKDFTIADLYAFFGFGLAGTLAKKVVGVELLAEQPRLAELLARLAERPSIARVTAEAAG